MDWCEEANRTLCKDVEGLVAASKTRRCAGAGHMGGETGNGTRPPSLPWDPGLWVTQIFLIQEQGS
jgi:hypothetical protein